MVEVLVAVLLIAMGLGSVLTMNVRSMQALRTARQAGAASQILQQRIEMLRDRPWPDVASAASLTRMLQTPTASESELADAGFEESMSVSVPGSDRGESFQVVRQYGGARALGQGDFRTEQSLRYETSVRWTDSTGPHERTLRTVITRFGLTRSGLFGNLAGRAAGPAAPAAGASR